MDTARKSRKPPTSPAIRSSDSGEYPKAIPEALLFDAVSFGLPGQAGPNDQMFISNVRISKD